MKKKQPTKHIINHSSLPWKHKIFISKMLCTAILLWPPVEHWQILDKPWGKLQKKWPPLPLIMRWNDSRRQPSHLLSFLTYAFVPYEAWWWWWRGGGIPFQMLAWHKHIYIFNCECRTFPLMQLQWTIAVQETTERDGGGERRREWVSEREREREPNKMTSPHSKQSAEITSTYTICHWRLKVLPKGSKSGTKLHQMVSERPIDTYHHQDLNGGNHVTQRSSMTIAYHTPQHALHQPSPDPLDFTLPITKPGIQSSPPHCVCSLTIEKAVVMIGGKQHPCGCHTKAVQVSKAPLTRLLLSYCGVHCKGGIGCTIAPYLLQWWLNYSQQLLQITVSFRGWASKWCTCVLMDTTWRGCIASSCIVQFSHSLLDL